MADDGDPTRTGNARIGSVPTDLLVVVALIVAVAVVALASIPWPSPIRVALGLVGALFLPGYAVIAALFPEAGGANDADAEATDDGNSDTSGAGAADETIDAGIDVLERVILSFGSSVAVVVLLALALNFTPWGIRRVPTVVAISGFTIACVGVAWYRRLVLPPRERFTVHLGTWASHLVDDVRNPPTRTDLILNVVLVCSLLLAAGSVWFAVTASPNGEPFTEFYLLTENESGDLVADDYPTNFTAGESKPIVVGVGNYEHNPATYTVVVETQRVTNQSSGPTVREQRKVTRFDTPRLADGETWHRSIGIAPTMTGERIKLQFLLYRSTPPADPSVSTAYRETHLWITVNEQGPS